MHGQDQTISAEEWTEILKVFDQLSVEAETDKTALLSQYHLTEQAQHILLLMLDSQSKGSILDHSIDSIAHELVEADTFTISEMPTDILGHKFGAWQLESVLAQGGMGQVYVAKRSDGQYEKQVALKLIKSGQYTEHTLQRFQEEMQVLARLEHPNIARMIDGGVNDEGISYIALELVEGQSIDCYAASNKLSLDERLLLMVQVCEAIECAHQNLVIHGDIKPDNILVNQSGQVKLVDFGISRSLLDQSDSRYLARYTPGFASPEQKQGLALTTGSDVYALSAVALTLCGFDVKDVCLDTSRSKWLAVMNQRKADFNGLGINANKLKSALSQELGSVIRKGMNKENSQRYKSVTDLKNDIVKVLNKEAVKSHSASKIYSIKKNIFRYKLAYSIAALGILGMLGFALFAFNQAAIAKQEAEKATWTSDFLKGIFDQADPVKNQLQPITANELTQLAADQLLTSSVSGVEVRLEALPLVSDIQSKLGQLVSAEALNLKVIELLQEKNASNTDLAKAHNVAGLNFNAQDKLDEAKQQHQLASELVPFSSKISDVSVNSKLLLANVLVRLNELDQAGEIIAEVLAVQAAVLQLESANFYMTKVYAIKADVAILNADLNAATIDVNEAQKYAKQLPEDFDLNAYVLGIESEVFYQKGDSVNAAIIDRSLASLYERRYGLSHPETLSRYATMAVSLSTAGETEEAIAVYKMVIKHSSEFPILMHLLPSAHLNIGTAYAVIEDFEKALAHYQIAESMWPQLEPRVPFYEASTEVRKARALMAVGQDELAETYFQKSFENILKVVDSSHPVYEKFQLMYLPFLLKQNKLDQAAAILMPAYDSYLEKYGLDSKRTAVLSLRMAQLADKKGKAIESLKHAKQTLATLDQPEFRSRYATEIAEAQALLH